MAVQNPTRPDEAARREAERQRLAATLNKTRESVSGVASGVMNFLDEGAAGAPNALQNITFDNSLPRQDIRDAQQRAVSQAQATQWVGDNPAQAQAGQQWAGERANDAVQAGIAPFRTTPPNLMPGQSPVQTVASTSPTAQAVPESTSPLDIGGINRALAERVADQRTLTPNYEPAQRGEYNMRQEQFAGTTASRAAAGAPANNGINFGFSQSYTPQDLNAQLRQTQQDNRRSRQSRLLEAETRWGANDKSSIGEIYASRQRQAGLGALLAGSDAATAADQKNSTDVTTANIQAQTALQNASTTAAATQAAASASGAATLEGQRLAAMARVEAAYAGQSGASEKSYAEAAARQRQVEMGDYYVSVGDMESATAAYAGYNPAEAPQLVQGLAGDVGTVTSRGLTPFTPEQREALYGKPKK